MATAAEPPPAAVTVLAGDKTEETESLRKQLEAARAAQRKAEQDAAQAQDELHRLTTPVTPSAEPDEAKPKREGRSRIFTFGRED